MFQFIENESYNVVKAMGVVQKDAGHLQISRRLGQSPGPDIDPSESLVYAGREGGHPIFVRTLPDGTQQRIVGHRSHFDPNDAYNVGKKNINGKSPVDIIESCNKELLKIQERAKALLEAKAKAEEAEAAAKASESSQQDSESSQQDSESDDSIEDANEFMNSSEDDSEDDLAAYG